MNEYHGGMSHEKINGIINDFEKDIGGRIDRIDQTVRDILQFVRSPEISTTELSQTYFAQEFTWASINEAHKSSSLGFSMKRLSWITVSSSAYGL